MGRFFYNKFKNIFNCLIIIDPIIIPELSGILQCPSIVMDTDICGRIKA